MTPKEITDIVTIMQRAPLQNMHEAKAVSELIEKLLKQFAPPPPVSAAESAKPAADE